MSVGANVGHRERLTTTFSSQKRHTMQAIGALILLLVASAAAAPSQPEQVSNVVNSGEYQLLGIHHQPPSELVDGTHLTISDASYQVVPGQQQQQGVQSPGVQVVNQAPVVQPAVVGGQPQSGNVEGVAQAAQGEQVGPQQQPQQQYAVHHPAVPSYYNAPAGLVTVVGNEQAVGAKPVSSGRNFEQYGQPESAALPPNYKPFGSWGLYIGGNPADGYYTNYYKALSNSVDKQQSGEPVKPVVVAGSQTAAFSPVLRQASSSPYVGNEYYSFAYSPADLNSVGRVGVEPVHPVPSQVVPNGQVVSPVQAGAQVYGSPAAFESNYGVSPYADAFVTKKVGAAYVQKEATKEVQVAPAAPKGYQSRVYVYPSVVGAPLAAPVQAQQAAGQQQLVAYPVPVGSQIVGSQPGVDGAFNPYGVHAFTRYAVKPTLLAQDPSYFVQSPNQQLPAYKQQVYTPQSSAASYYPYGSYYGYPLSQLHYSQGSVGPSVHNEPVHHGAVVANQVEAASEKSESEEKIAVNKQQKRA